MRKATQIAIGVGMIAFDSPLVSVFKVGLATALLHIKKDKRLAKNATALELRKKEIAKVLGCDY